MDNHRINRKRGFIKYILVIIALVILVAYFKSDILRLLNSPEIKNALLTAIDWTQKALLWIVGKLVWTSSQLK